MAMIFVECYHDEFLVLLLGVKSNIVRHEGCKSSVVRKLQNYSKSIGMVDHDGGANNPAFMALFKTIKTKKFFNSIQLLEYKKDATVKLILIKPNLETWLIRRAKRKVTTRSFPVQTEKELFNYLHETQCWEQDNHIKQFLQNLIKKDREVQTLKSWLQ